MVAIWEVNQHMQELSVSRHKHIFKENPLSYVNLLWVDPQEWDGLVPW